MSNFGELPIELLSLILQHVEEDDYYHCALINRRLYKMANPLVWRQGLYYDCDDDFNKILTTLDNTKQPLGEYVRLLHFNYFATNDVLTKAMHHLRFLEQVELLECEQLTDTSMLLLPQHCPHLRKVTVTECPTTAAFVTALGQHCHQLHHLTLHHCTNLSVDVFAALTTCRSLVELDIDVTHMNDIYDDSAHLAAMHLTSLNRLTLLNIDGATPDLCETMVNEPTSWPHLTTFQVDACQLVDDDDAIAWIQCHPHLTALQLARNSFSDDVLDAIAAWLPGLVKLDLAVSDAITSHGLRRLVCHCPLLAEVALYRCHDIDPAGIPEYNAMDLLSWILRTGNTMDEYYVRSLNQDVINKIRQADPTTGDNNNSHGLERS